MITLALIAAAFLIAALGIAHSVVGERYIVRRLLRRELPQLFGATTFTAGVIRFAWHLTTVVFLGLAGVLVAVALGATASAVVVIVGCTFIVSAALPIWFTRGRHLAWIVLLVAGGLCIAAAAGM